MFIYDHYFYRNIWALRKHDLKGIHMENAHILCSKHLMETGSLEKFPMSLNI